MTMDTNEGFVIHVGFANGTHTFFGNAESIYVFPNEEMAQMAIDSKPAEVLPDAELSIMTAEEARAHVIASILGAGGSLN